MEREQLIEGILNHFHIIVQKMKSKAHPSSEKSRITHSQWFVLGMIESCQNTNVKHISKQLSMSSSAVTQLVDGLVTNGYVTRKEDPVDRRSILLEISTKGKKEITHRKKKRLDKMEKLFAPLTDAELENYLKLNQKIASVLLKCDA